MEETSFHLRRAFASADGFLPATSLWQEQDITNTKTRKERGEQNDFLEAIDLFSDEEIVLLVQMLKG